VEAVGAAGLGSLVIPVRPPDKALVPGGSMVEYASAVHTDGLIGGCALMFGRGLIAGVDPCSATGALAPVFVSIVDYYAVYVEANV
jgi:hypothetical protein